MINNLINQAGGIGKLYDNDQEQDETNYDNDEDDTNGGNAIREAQMSKGEINVNPNHERE